MDAGAEQIGVGGALFLAALGMLLKFKPWAPPREKAEKAGEKTPEWWTQEFERLTEKAVRSALVTRNEDIRRILREELERLHRR